MRRVALGSLIIKRIRARFTPVRIAHARTHTERLAAYASGTSAPIASSVSSQPSALAYSP
jgi:hypothetical protein